MLRECVCVLCECVCVYVCSEKQNFRVAILFQSIYMSCLLVLKVADI